MTPQQLAEKTWDLYQSHGVPIEVSEDILAGHGLEMDKSHLESLIEEHQKKSQDASAGQFKSGLGGDTAKTRKLHTVTHILHTQLREMFGETVKQMGSAITDEKARFDFSLERAMSEYEVAQLQAKVQEVINHHLLMQKAEMSPDKARELGAIGLFGEKYGDIVSVYSLTDESGKVYSREFCGGPHIENTEEIGTFKILKQKSVGQGVRRIEFDVA
jgi:alanyl-tRNA synthetase